LLIAFPSLEEGLHIARRFYGQRAVCHLEMTRRAALPFAVVGVKEPRDLCWLEVQK
jgi:hypothetical protein